MSSVASFLGNMIGRCFACYTEVALDFGPTSAAVATDDASNLSALGTNGLIATGINSLLVGALGDVVLERKRTEKEVIQGSDICFGMIIVRS